MTKAVICQTCSDIVSPPRDWQTNRSWRECSCQHVATRWRNGNTGELEVVSLHGPDAVRVLGLNNDFLFAAFSGRYGMHGDWRDLHAHQAETVPSYYLFHKDKRNCWALLIRPGDTADTFFMGYTIPTEAVVPDER